MSLFSFRKDEILRKKKLIDNLFAGGTSFFNYPFKIFWLAVPLETPFPAQILISVSKRAFKHAVDRNRVRRQIREAYRKNKFQLYEYFDQHHIQGTLAIVYTAGVHLPSAEIEIKIKAVIKRLIKDLDRKLNNPFPNLSDNKNN
jgi:ribonuclease P protein component